MCRCTSKLLLCIVSLIFWAFAAFMMGVGIWVFSKYQHLEEFTQYTYTLIPATIMIAVGVFLVVLGIVGIIGAFKEHRCLLGTFFSVMLLIFLGLVVTSCLAYFYRYNVDAYITKAMDEGWLTKYGKDKAWTDEIDTIQQNVHCCGINSSSDWMRSAWYTNQNRTHPLPYPTSCCRNNTCVYPAPGKNDTALYTVGCHDELRRDFKLYLGAIAGSAAGFAAVMLLGMVSACILICRRRSSIPYLGLAGDGMQV